MKRVLLLLCLAFCSYSLSAQEEDLYTEYDDQYIDYREETKPFRFLDSPMTRFGIYVVTTPFFKQQAFGFGFDGQLQITNNFSTGLSLTAASRRISPDFGYTIGDARMTFGDISWLNELTLIQENNIEIGARAALGWVSYMLRDNSIRERYWVWTEYGGYEAEQALLVADNKFFKLAPGLAVRYRLGKDIQLEANGAYNFYFGNTDFGNRVTFNNYVLQLGIKIRVN